MSIEQTKNQLLFATIEEYLEEIEDLDMIPSAEEMESEIIRRQNEAILLRNEVVKLDPNGNPILDRNGNPKTMKRPDAWRLTERLEPVQIAHILAKRHHVVRIRANTSYDNPDQDYLAVYQTEGPHYGTYVLDHNTFSKLARRYSYTLTIKDFEEVMAALRDLVPRVTENSNSDLIAVNNGIFDYKTKLLHPFSPDYIFLSKSHVDYVEDAPNPVITMPDGELWDVESWMESLSDDPEIINLLWEILGAIIRPHVKWNKSAWFYSERGNNGKGTLCELMRNICGPGTYVSLPLNRFNEDAMLEPLVGASAIITDENDVGTYIDQGANLKAIITQDVLSINRKYKTAITFRFNGFMVQCVNELPRMRDRSNSMHRRLLIVPFTKSFEGMERRYIKHDYLSRKEVLEYVLYKVLNMDYYTLTEPNISTDILDEYKVYNDPVRQFWQEIRTELSWDLVPFNFLHDLYRSWMRKNNAEGKPVSRANFTNQIVALLEQGDDLWYVEDKNKKYRPADKMKEPEPLILEYDLDDWVNKTSKSSNPSVRATVDPYQLKDNYRGILRR